MTIPSRPIGQDPVSQQLWYISKQIERLIGVVSNLIPTTTTTSTSTTTSTTTTTLP